MPSNAARAGQQKGGDGTMPSASTYACRNPANRRPASSGWNKGRIVGQLRPLALTHVWSIRLRLEMADDTRDLTCSCRHRSQVARLRPCLPEGPRCICRWLRQGAGIGDAEQDRKTRPVRNHSDDKAVAGKMGREPREDQHPVTSDLMPRFNTTLTRA